MDEEQVVLELLKLLGAFVAEKKRENDLRALELTWQVQMVLAEAEEHSISFEFVEAFGDRVDRCGK